ncbi:arsenic efflux protein [bacterium]|nr:arsenic efflux protein [bacterium]
MLIKFLEQISNFNEIVIDFIMKFVQVFNIPEFLHEPIAESINLIPFLFIIFVFIEISENYFSEKIENLSLSSRIWGPFIGSCLASLPQCGFSIIVTVLYLKKFVSLGTLIAVYVSTSDEAIPILLANPDMFSSIFPLIFTKIIIGVISGYLIDFIFKPKLVTCNEIIEVDEHGCCHHEIHSKISKLLLHPLKHTLNIFLFILLINCLLSTAFNFAENVMTVLFNTNMFLQILAASLIGLIPNCAASVLIVMLYLKSVIGFGSLIAGLSTNAGLGLLVLFKNNNDLKDSFRIVGILLAIAVVSGLILQIFS